MKTAFTLYIQYDSSACANNNNLTNYPPSK